MSFENAHHFTDLTLVDDADQHVLISVGVHAMYAQLCHTVTKLFHQLLRQCVRLVGDDLKLVAILQSAQAVVDNHVCDKQIEKRTDHRRDPHAVHKKCDCYHARVHDKGYISNVQFGVRPTKQCRYTVSASARTKALKHKGKAKARDHARCDAGKHDVKILGVVFQTVRTRTEIRIELRQKGLHAHVDDQHAAQLAVDHSADQDKVK